MASRTKDDIQDDNDRQHREEALDEALEETFPASDPPANTVETGIRIDTSRVSEDGVTDNHAASRFELVQNGEVAFLAYERQPHALRLIHTEVPPSLRGHHLGDHLVNAALEAGRAEGLRIVAVCPFVRTYLRKHPEGHS